MSMNFSPRCLIPSWRIKAFWKILDAACSGKHIDTWNISLIVILNLRQGSSQQKGASQILKTWSSGILKILA